MCGSDGKGGLPPPFVCSTLGGVTRGQPRRERYCTQMGGGTPPQPAGGQYYYMGGGPPPHPNKATTTTGGYPGSHVFGQDRHSCKCNVLKIQRPPNWYCRGLPPPHRQNSRTTTGGYPGHRVLVLGGGTPPQLSTTGGYPPPHKKAPLLLPRGGVPPPLRSNSVSVVKEKRPSRTSCSFVRLATTSQLPCYPSHSA